MELDRESIKIVKEILNDKDKRALYTESELEYMKLQVKTLVEGLKSDRKHKGFGNNE